ncbi:mitochondrial carnitine/acylcarnitine carrier-like protein [Kwoniella heveanensis CBS 569]|nr:mitochondrial carnitine/acylcarnitine carrier-like protein [Kwoniella heveanensis CBS 569]
MASSSTSTSASQKSTSSISIPEEISDPDIIDDIEDSSKIDGRRCVHEASVKTHGIICDVGPPLISTAVISFLYLARGRTPIRYDKNETKEGPRALYKGASVPAVAWGITDSILMGSLHNYRALLLKNGFAERIHISTTSPSLSVAAPGERLSLLGHSVAGLFAGWTNAAIAHPTEVIKCKLQLQLVQPEHVPKQFSGPIDVVRQTVAEHGVTGMWRGLGASFIYRSCFAAMFGGFEIFNRLFKSWDGTSWEMSTELCNFLAGGMASNMYWFTALPLDNIKNRIMVDSIKQPRYKGVFDAYGQVWRETYDPSKGFSWNSLARIRNFYKVS